MQVTIKDDNLKSITRQTTLPHSTDLSSEILHTALKLTLENRPPAVRALTVTVSGLTDRQDGEQTSLFAEEELPDLDRQRRLENTLDALRGRFGWDAVTPGTALQNDIGIGDGSPHGAEDGD